MSPLRSVACLCASACIALFACKDTAAAHPPAAAPVSAEPQRSTEQPQTRGPFANLEDPAEGVVVRVRRYREARYLTAVVDLRQNTLGLCGQTSGTPRRFAELEEDVAFATNAGMFHRGYTPVGLQIEDRVERGALNLEEGAGNFFMKPNGVFFIRGGAAAILTAEAFGNEETAETMPIDLATQSGPMLVIESELHPRFLPESDSLYIRSGVGVRDEHTVVFVLSLDEVRFHDLATLFRDELACPNALYLDGDISAAYVRGQPRLPNAWRSFGGLVTVTPRRP